VLRADNFVSFTCRLSRNSGTLNLLEPKGTLLACVGIGIGSIIDKRRVNNVVKVGTVSNRGHGGISYVSLAPWSRGLTFSRRGCYDYVYKGCDALRRDR